MAPCGTVLTFDGLRNGTRKKILSPCARAAREREATIRSVAASVCPRKIFARVESSSNTSCPVIFRVLHAARICAPRRAEGAHRGAFGRVRKPYARDRLGTQAYYLCTHGCIACRWATFATPKFLCTAITIEPLPFPDIFSLEKN